MWGVTSRQVEANKLVTTPKEELGLDQDQVMSTTAIVIFRLLARPSIWA